METATIRIPEAKKNLLKAVASLENRTMNDIIVDLIDSYIERRKESAEIMAVPGLFESIKASSREFRRGKSVPIRDVRKKLGR